MWLKSSGFVIYFHSGSKFLNSSIKLITIVKQVETLFKGKEIKNNMKKYSLYLNHIYYKL